MPHFPDRISVPRLVLLLAISLLPVTTHANDSFNSEISHVAGFSIMAGSFTAIADHTGYRDDRAWLGFAVTSGIGILSESVEALRDGGPISALDIGSDLLGAAIGSYVTDRWLLAPVVRPEQHYAGLRLIYAF